MAENLCNSCTAACCKGPTTMALTEEEHRQMEGAGTRFRTIAPPADHDRDDVPYPISWVVDPKSGKILRYEVDSDKPTEPLAAGLGRYTMFGTCGNLVNILGREQCGIYDSRPQVCRDFEAGEDKCNVMRFFAQLEAISNS